MKNNFDKGFTLAEILITLAVIGVIAVLTIPGMVKKYHKLIAVNQLKQAYSEISSIIKNAETVYGPVENWKEIDVNIPWYKKDINKVITDYLIPQTTGAKFYQGTSSDSVNDNALCVDNSSLKMQTVDGTFAEYLWLNGKGVSAPFTKRTASFALNKGVCYGFTPLNDNFYVVDLYIDINGSYKEPNTAGKDLFFFKLGKDGNIYPYGYGLEETKINGVYKDACNNKNKYLSSLGKYCAARVINAGWNTDKEYPW